MQHVSVAKKWGLADSAACECGEEVGTGGQCSSWMICSCRPKFVVCLECFLHRSSPLTPSPGSDIHVAMYSGGSGCFPLLLPGCCNPCILRPVIASPEPPCCKIDGT